MNLISSQSYAQLRTCSVIYSLSFSPSLSPPPLSLSALSLPLSFLLSVALFLTLSATLSPTLSS